MEILKRVVNNKLLMVYYLIVYTVLLVQFPKKKFVGPPHQQNLDPPLLGTVGWLWEWEEVCKSFS